MGENNKANGKLSWPVRLSYAGGDVACNVVFGMVGTLLTHFTQTMSESGQQL